MKERADLIVVGGGAAGACAAIFARQRGLDVLLVDRGFFGRSGCSALASGMFSYYRPEDDWEYWLSNHGGTMVDRSLLKQAIARQYDLVHWMEEWGVEWVKEEGQIARMGGPGIPFPHSAMMVGGGPRFMMSIRNYAVDIGVRVLSRTLVTDFLTSDGRLPTEGRVVGVHAMNTRSGELYELGARAVINAAGPMHFPYPRPDSPFTGMPSELSGDGIAFAIRVGAELGKMEIGGDGLVQALFHSAQGFEMLLGLGGHFVNGENENFLNRYAETSGQGTNSRRSSLGNAAVAEIVAGRGPVLRDNNTLTANDVRLLENVIPIIMKTFASAGLSVERHLVPYTKAMIGSTAVSGAGMRINQRGQSSVLGLYGAGNTTDGAYVIMGQNLSTCAVMGHWAGHAVADDLPDLPFIPPDSTQVQALSTQALAPRERESGLDYETVHSALEALMLDMGLVMDSSKLTKAIDGVSEIEEDQIPRLKATDWHSLTKVLGLRNFAAALRTSYEVMLHRQESRGNVLRSDFPYTDNKDWLVRTIARWNGIRTVIRDEPRPNDERFAHTDAERTPHPFFDMVEPDLK